MELCNELNINANKKTRYDRLDVAQKVVNIKSVLKVRHESARALVAESAIGKAQPSAFRT